MSGRPILKGSTNVSTIIRIIDSTDGTPETGVTSATAGLDLEYRREGGLVVDITESNLAALNDAHSDGGMLHVGNGYYRLDLPDAAVASGADGVLVQGTATGMIVIGTYHPLVDYNPQDGVRLGLTALPNAAADAAGGLPISDAGALDLDAKIGALTFTVANKVDANATHISGDSTAADNAEAMFDGTGYAGGTTKLGVNVAQWLGNAVTQINLSNVQKSVSNTSVSQYRGDYWDMDFASLGAITGNVDVWLTIKENAVSDTDANAIALISKTVGLEVLNKSASGLTAANGSVTVTDATAGDITVTLKASDTAQIAPRDYAFDIQWKDASGDVFTLAKGTFTVLGDVTRATT